MSVELVDKGVSTKDLETECGEVKEQHEENAQEKEEKNTLDYEKLNAVLSALMENKMMSIREQNKESKKTFFGMFRTKSESGTSAQTDPKKSNYRFNLSSATESSCRHLCHHSHNRRSFVPSEPAELSKYKNFRDSQQQSVESDTSQPPRPAHTRQSFPSYEASRKKPEDCHHQKYYGKRLDKKALSVQKSVPKRLATRQWLYSTRQASIDTATTSSDYTLPNYETADRCLYSTVSEVVSQQADALNGSTNGIDHDTIIDMSEVQNESEVVNEFGEDEEENVERSNRSYLCERGIKCDETCFTTLPPSDSTPYLPSSCRNFMQEDQICCSAASHRHSHPSGEHYVSCCNSPSFSVQSKFPYDEKYFSLAMKPEDLQFEEEEQKRKMRKRRKKRRRDRQARARGLMADELKKVKQGSKPLGPEDLPKKARWTIVATACLLLLMSMLLVGVTLRMAPIIDEMVRKENEEMLNSLNRQGSFKGVQNLINKTATKSSATNSSEMLQIKNYTLLSDDT